MTDTSNKVLYRGMDKAALDAAYNNSAAVANSADLMARGRERSAVVRAGPRAKLDIAYGSRPRERLDYFASGATKPPLLVFIHGGYWQRNDKDMFAFIADGPRPHGIDVALVGYTLAPDARLTDIVAEIRRSLSYLAEHADALGFDRSKLFVSGWSAGGHLTAMAADHPAVRGGMPISGIFDLEPIALCYLDDKLKLSPDEITRLSPLRHAGAGLPPLSVFVGGAELPELRRQSHNYVQAARQCGAAVELSVLPDHHHFSILDEWSRNGALTQALVRLTGTG